mmetsp:Transcript_19278/g.33757  ORF Transcript_19278/g.33757 Transcript_19278/m.33757 type:complete len:239 (-) Transcript_19278:218-934(-)
MNKSLLPGLAIADATDVFAQHNADGIHPNDMGHHLIAFRVHQLLTHGSWPLVEPALARPTLCLTAQEMMPTQKIHGFQLRQWVNNHKAIKFSWQAWKAWDRITFILPADATRIFVKAYTRPNMSAFQVEVPLSRSNSPRESSCHTTGQKYPWLPHGRGLEMPILVATGYIPKGAPLTIINRCAKTCELQITGLLLDLIDRNLSTREQRAAPMLGQAIITKRRCQESTRGRAGGEPIVE